MPDFTLQMPRSIVSRADAGTGSKSIPLFPLEVTGLSFEVGNRRPIDKLDFKLSANGITIVMGPNGAGKSLLLRLLHGLISPSEGTISWAGQQPHRDVQRRQALVFQKPVLLRRSVAENIDFVLRLHGSADVAERSQLLARVGLNALSRQPARRLSGGEQQRLALARALAVRPEVLLLDEPTSSLDPASVQMIEQIVCEAARSGVKIIFVTHDIGQARRLASDVVFLHRGSVAEHAPATDFFANPTSEAARDFLAGNIVL